MTAQASSVPLQHSLPAHWRWEVEASGLHVRVQVYEGTQQILDVLCTDRGSLRTASAHPTRLGSFAGAAIHEACLLAAHAA
jgi:hypothetical protein